MALTTLIRGTFLLALAAISSGCIGRSVVIQANKPGCVVYARTRAIGFAKLERIGTTPCEVDIEVPETRYGYKVDGMPKPLPFEVAVLHQDTIRWVDIARSIDGETITVDMDSATKITESEDKLIRQGMPEFSTDSDYGRMPSHKDILRALGYPDRSFGSAGTHGTSSTWVYERWDDSGRFRVPFLTVHFSDGVLVRVSN